MDDKVQIGFKYERLVGLCYQCGKFGHELKECTEQMNTQLVDRPYGEWLKASYRWKEGVSYRATHSPTQPKTVPKNASKDWRPAQSTFQEGRDAINGINFHNEDTLMQMNT